MGSIGEDAPRPKPSRRLRSIAHAFAGVLLLMPAAATAQIAGVAVFHSMKHDPNYSVHVDFGHAGGDVAGDYLGLRFTRAIGGESDQGPLRVSVMAGGSFGEGDDVFAAGASAGLAILQRRLIQMEPAIGIGWTGGSNARIDIPASIAIGIVGSLPPSSATRFASENPQIWVAPRVQVRLADDASGSTAVRGGAGGGAGIELRWLRGFGLQAVFEMLAMRDAVAPRWHRETALGLSLFFAWI